jgi:hypothetical protein
MTYNGNPETARQPDHRVIDTETSGPTKRPTQPQHTRPPDAVTPTSPQTVTDPRS